MQGGGNVAYKNKNFIIIGFEIVKKISNN